MRNAYDLLIKNGRIVDGTGSPWFTGDVAIRGDVIARIAPSIAEPAARVIDVHGSVIAPGFIEMGTLGGVTACRRSGGTGDLLISEKRRLLVS